MPGDDWGANTRKIGNYLAGEEDEEEEPSPVIRRNGRTLNPEQAEQEIQRQRELAQAQTRARADEELARTLRVPAGGYRVGLTEVRRLVAEDKKRLERDQAQETDKGVQHEA